MDGSFSPPQRQIIQRRPKTCFAASVRLGIMKRGGSALAQSWSDRYLASIRPALITLSRTQLNASSERLVFVNAWNE